MLSHGIGAQLVAGQPQLQATFGYLPSKNTCNVSGLALAARLTAATGCCLLALMRSEFYVVAQDPFGSEQGTLSPALLASHLVIFFWFNPRSDRALNPQWIRRTAAGPRHVREQGGSRSAARGVFGLVGQVEDVRTNSAAAWLSAAAALCAPRVRSRCVVSHFIGRQEKQGRTFVRFRVTDPKHRRKNHGYSQRRLIDFAVESVYKNTV